MKEIEFGGKLVVVTGAASGIGLYVERVCPARRKGHHV